jgi:hypothetical protein
MSITFRALFTPPGRGVAVTTTLIITEVGDTHAHAVQWALQAAGHLCQRWLPERLGEQPVTLRISDSTVATELSGPDGGIDPESVRSIWLRRFGLPVFPDFIEAGDRAVAKRETENFLRGLKYGLGEGRKWFNPPAAQRVAGLKSRQLHLARNAGFRIPNTIMTTSADEVRSFVDSVAGPVIYKGFHPAFWRREDEKASRYWLRTAIVSKEDLDDPDSLKLSPGIFQEFIAKAFELRVTVFGRTYIAAQITEQDGLDWRNSYDMKLSPCVLPTAVEETLFCLMDEMGLVMGAVDLIVTPEGEYVFLEINEQGQFLWIEEINPQIRLLAPFAQFLEQGDPEFRWDGQSNQFPAFDQYRTSAEAKLFEQTEVERMPDNSFQVEEPVDDSRERLT